MKLTSQSKTTVSSSMDKPALTLQKNKHLKHSTKTTRAPHKSSSTKASTKIQSKTVKIEHSPYLSNIGQSFLQRCYVAGGWVQQGFEKVFTLTFFSKKGKKLNEYFEKNASQEAHSKKIRSYGKTHAKKSIAHALKSKKPRSAKDLTSKALIKHPKLLSRKA